MSISMKNLSFAYGDTPILEDITWCLPDKGIVCLWGPSGCGKTTLLRLLAGLEQPYEGVVDGAERVSVVFQEDRLLPWMTALQNVTVVGAEAAAAYDLLMSMGLTEEETVALPCQLSGGQQRRVALARALATDSDLLLLDEPFNGLDEDTWHNVVPQILAYAQCKPVVLVTHIREQAEALGAWLIPLRGIPLTGVLPGENL